MSKSALYTILNLIKPSHQKSLQGLDYYLVDGDSAIDELINIVKKSDCSNDQKQVFLRLAENVRVYLKVEYSKNCTFESSCPSHCGCFAVSDPSDTQLQQQCTIPHDNLCVKCANIFKMFQYVEEIINEQDDAIESIVWEVNKSKNEILEWQKHLIRHVIQNEAKNFIARNIKEGILFLIFDWQMKPMPKKFHEKQTDWFGKKGFSSHIAVGTTIVNNVVKKKSLVMVSDSSDQDLIDTLCVIKSTISHYKILFPSTHTVIAKMDNASCYSGKEYTVIYNLAYAVYRKQYI